MEGKKIRNGKWHKEEEDEDGWKIQWAEPQNAIDGTEVEI